MPRFHLLTCYQFFCHSLIDMIYHLRLWLCCQSLCWWTLFSLFLIPGFFLRCRLYSILMDGWLILQNNSFMPVFVGYPSSWPVTGVMQGMRSSTNTDPELLRVSWPTFLKPSYAETLEPSVWTSSTIQKMKWDETSKTWLGTLLWGVEKPRTMTVKHLVFGTGFGGHTKYAQCCECGMRNLKFVASKGKLYFLFILDCVGLEIRLTCQQPIVFSHHLRAPRFGNSTCSPASSTPLSP